MKHCNNETVIPALVLCLALSVCSAGLPDGNLQCVDLSDLDADLPLDAVSTNQILWQTQDWEHGSFRNPGWPSGGGDSVGFPALVKNTHGLNQDSRYYLYYAHHDPMSGIGCAVADTITGPYTKISPTDSKVLTVPNYNPAGPNPDDPSHYSSPSVVWNEDEQLWFLYFHYYNHYWGGAGDPPGESWGDNNPGLGHQMTGLATTPDLSSHSWTIWTDPAWSRVSVWNIVPVLPTTDEAWMESQSSYHAIQRLPGGQWLAFLRGTADSGLPTVGFGTSTDGRSWSYFTENPVIGSGKPWTLPTSEYRPKFIGYLGKNGGVDEYLVAWSENSHPSVIYSTTTDFKTFVRDPRGYATWGVGDDGIVTAFREGDRLYLFSDKFVYEMALPVSNPFICMYGHHDGAGVTDAFREFIPPFNVIEGTGTDAAFILELRAQGRVYAKHVNNPADENAAQLLARWRAPYDDTLGGQLPGGYDAIAIDELHGAHTDGTAHSDAVVSALQQLKTLYPDKKIFVAAVWQYGSSSSSYTDQLNACNTYADMLMVECYIHEGNLSYGWLGGHHDAYAAKLNAAVPGILGKTVYGLYISQHGFVADSVTGVGYWGHLDEQIHRIRNDSDAATMPGVMFWAYYRSETELTPDYCARLCDHYFVQGNTGYFGDGSNGQMIGNPGFDSDTSGWTLTPGSGGTVQRFNYGTEGVRDNHSADPIRAMGQGPSYVSHGSDGLKMVRGSTYNRAFCEIAVDTGMTHTVSAWVLADGENRRAKVTITEAGGTYVESEEISHVGTVDYARIAFSFSAPSSPVRIVLNDETTAPGTTLYWDFVELEPAYPAPPEPPLVDEDEDGLNDNWEIRFFGSITNTAGGADEDWDLDRFIDRFEHDAGTDPTNPASLLAVTDVRRVPPGSVEIFWSSVSGRFYSIWAGTDLLAHAGGTLGGLAATPPTNSRILGVPFPQLFYRIGLEQ